MPDFQILGEVTGMETIAEGKTIRDLSRLVKTYGVAHWRKRKGMATSNSPAAELEGSSFIGMKRMASAERS